MVEATHAALADGVESVLVDDALEDVGWPAGGHPRRAVEYLLRMEGIPFERVSGDEWGRYRLEEGDHLLFLAGQTVLEVGAVGLTTLDSDARPGEQSWGLYRSAGQ
jgi:hypothetical protein